MDAVAAQVLLATEAGGVPRTAPEGGPQPAPTQPSKSGGKSARERRQRANRKQAACQPAPGGEAPSRRGSGPYPRLLGCFDAGAAAAAPAAGPRADERACTATFAVAAGAAPPEPSRGSSTDSTASRITAPGSSEGGGHPCPPAPWQALFPDAASLGIGTSAPGGGLYSSNPCPSDIDSLLPMKVPLPSQSRMPAAPALPCWGAAGGFAGAEPQAAAFPFAGGFGGMGPQAAALLFAGGFGGMQPQAAVAAQHYAGGYGGMGPQAAAQAVVPPPGLEVSAGERPLVDLAGRQHLRPAGERSPAEAASRQGFRPATDASARGGLVGVPPGLAGAAAPQPGSAQAPQQLGACPAPSGLPAGGALRLPEGRRCGAAGPKGCNSPSSTVSPAGARSPGSTAARERRFTCRFVFGGFDLERDEDFELVPRLIGRGGANMREIARACDGKVRIRGRGSGYREQQKGRGGQEEADVPLQIALSCRDGACFEEGRTRLASLLGQIGQHFERYCRKKGLVPAPALYTCVDGE